MLSKFYATKIYKKNFNILKLLLSLFIFCRVNVFQIQE